MNRRQFLATSTAGTLTATFGSDTPLLLETGPPSVTRHRMSLPVTSVTSIRG